MTGAYADPMGLVDAEGKHTGVLGNELWVNAGKSELAIDIWGNQVTTQPESLFESTYTFALSNRKWLVYHNGTEIVFDSNNPDTHVRTVGGALQLNVDATFPTVKAESRECPKYQSNREHKFSTAMIIPTAATDCVHAFGLRTAENGV